MIGLLLLSVASAGPLSHWGAGEAGFSAATATDDGPMAAWTNPAAMSTERIESTAELLLAGSQLEADGTALYSQTGPGLSLGATTNGYFIGQERLHLGIAMHLPLLGPYGWVAEPEAVLDTEPIAQSPRFSQDLTRLDAALAANYALTDAFAIGVGIDISASIETLTDVIVDDLAAPENALRAQEVRIKPTLHPYIGLLATVGDRDGVHARIGLLARSARQLHDFGTSFLLFGTGAFVYRHDFTRFYAPPQGTLSVDVRPTPGLSLRAEASYEAWAGAPGPYGEDLGEAWRSTVVMRLGARFDVGPIHPMIGWSRDPGPAVGVPAGTLHLDGRSQTVTTGVGLRVVDREGEALDVHAGGSVRRFAGNELDGHRLEGQLVGLRVGVTAKR